MPRYAAILLVAAACGGSAPPPPVPRADGAGPLRVLTWNVHDLFDEVDRLVPPGELDAVPSIAEVEAKLDRVAAVLRRLDADVALLQEVENLPLLRRLAARTGHREAWLVDGNDPRGIDVGILSRLPVLAFRGHASERTPDGRLLWPRDAVEAVIDAPGRPLVLIGTHLSSAISDPTGVRRRLQASRLRELADAAAARAPPSLVVVGGDLNDAADAPSLGPLLGDGAWVDADGGVAPAPYTWSSGSAWRALDHLALPAADAGAVLAAGPTGGADVDAASDHRPVILDLLP